MAHYAVYRKSDGVLVSVGTAIEPDTLDRSLAYVELAHAPTGEERWDPAAHAFVPRLTSKDEIEAAKLQPYYEAWLRWKMTLAEAKTRNLPPAVITALTDKVEHEWQQYVEAVLEWRNA